MAASLPATADSLLRHVMTPNPRTLLLPTNITVRAVQRGLPANLRLVARRHTGIRRPSQWPAERRQQDHGRDPRQGIV